MGFQDTLDQNFPEATPEADFIERATSTLGQHGFHRDNSIAAVCCCRDEISQTLQEAVARNWGLAFNKSSLAGMVLSGKTGFGAALAHSPQENGRERYVFFAMPHVAVGRDGEQGVTYRPGRNAPSSACGALLAVLGEVEAGTLDTEFHPEDVEQSLLRARLATRLEEGETPDLFELTRKAHDVIVEDLERTIELTVDPSSSDYAVITGIQLHGPDGINYVQPLIGYAVVDGQRSELQLLEVAA